MSKKEAIVIVGGGLKREADGRWRTTTFEDKGDNFGLSGDKLRVIAASYLYKENPKMFIVALGGKGQLKNIQNAPNVSAIIKKELIDLGVAEEKIIEENNSGTTYQQLEELKKIIKEKKLKYIMIVSNEYHLPRIKAMIEALPQLKEMSKLINIELIAAEKVLLDYDRETWQEIIKIVYNSQAMKKRIQLEQKGIKDIKEGRYKFR